jgi:hypothetical protein
MHLDQSLLKTAGLLCLGALVVCALVAAFLWIVWIRCYIRASGAVGAPAILNIAPLQDYLKARSIAREAGQTRWFLNFFRILIWVDVVLAAGFLITVFLP